jgi:hypothetical protein
MSASSSGEMARSGYEIVHIIPGHLKCADHHVATLLQKRAFL